MTSLSKEAIQLRQATEQRVPSVQMNNVLLDSLDSLDSKHETD